MHIIKSVGVFSIAKIMGLIYGCIGLIFTPIFLIFGLLGAALGKSEQAPGVVIGVIFAILVPILYGGLGFILGAIGAFLYNLIAKVTGGIELELVARAQPPMAPYPVVQAPVPLPPAQ